MFMCICMYVCANICENIYTSGKHRSKRGGVNCKRATKSREDGYSTWIWKRMPLRILRGTQQ